MNKLKRNSYLAIGLFFIASLVGYYSINELNSDDGEKSKNKQDGLEGSRESTVIAKDTSIGYPLTTETESNPDPKPTLKPLWVNDKKQILICIDPGHQRRANLEHEPVGPGANETKMKVTGGTKGAKTGKPEYQLVFEASLLLRDELQKRGFDVVLTRESHDVNLSNRERAEIANQNKADLFIRVHADGSNNPNMSGFHILTPGKNNPYTTEIFLESLSASQHILEEVNKNKSIKVNGITERNDLSGFNWSKVPSTLIEIGYMTNQEEDEKLSDMTYLSNIMNAIVDGIERYFSQ